MSADRDEKQVACNPDVLAKAVGGETVLVHLKTNRIYELNRTAARLWALLEEQRSLAEIQQTLVAEFSVEPEAVKLEMDALLEELLDEQLVLPR
jgi:hypothetical protein